MSTAEIDQSVVNVRIAEVRKEAERFTQSADPLVHVAWVIQGLDLWHRSDGKMGHNLAKTEDYVLSHVIRMLLTPNDTEIAA